MTPPTHIKQLRFCRTGDSTFATKASQLRRTERSRSRASQRRAYPQPARSPEGKRFIGQSLGARSSGREGPDSALINTYLLDASAALDFLEDGPGAERIEQLMREARRSSTPMLMSVLNWGELFYPSWQRRGEESAKSTLADLSRLPIELVPVDTSQVLKAGEFKVVHKIPYVDCVAAALSVLRQSDAGDRRPQLRKTWKPSCGFFESSRSESTRSS